MMVISLDSSKHFKFDRLVIVHINSSYALVKRRENYSDSPIWHDDWRDWLETSFLELVLTASPECSVREQHEDGATADEVRPELLQVWGFFGESLFSKVGLLSSILQFVFIYLLHFISYFRVISGLYFVVNLIT